MTAPSSTMMLALGADLKWPRVQVGACVLAGERAWRGAMFGCPPLAPAERSHLLGRLERHLLVATDNGRARLRRWLDQRILAPSSPMPGWLLPRWVAERVAFYGDKTLFQTVVTALVMVPAPVRDAVLCETAFLAVGLDSAAWTGSSRFVDRNGQEKTRVVNLGPKVDVPTALHEIGHCWHGAIPSEHSALVTVQGEAGVLALADRQNWRARADALLARDERLAEGLALVWGASAR